MIRELQDSVAGGRLRLAYIYYNIVVIVAIVEVRYVNNIYICTLYVDMDI